VVQAILAALGEADDPDKVDYFTLNKEQPLHLDINVDPDQVGLDNEEFQDEEDDKAVPEENITLDNEEKLKATESPLSKVHILKCENLIFGLLICFSYATSQTRLFQALSGGRSFGNARSQNITRKTPSTRTDERHWRWSEMCARVGTTRMQ
jgi:hypothetical protein